MKKMLLDVVTGVVAYYICGVIFTALITGTSTMDTLIKTLVPIAVGIATAFVALKSIK